jgi:2,3-dihydroxybenzoate decarboxylase
MLFLSFDKTKDGIDKINKYIDEGKDIFILVFMEGCGPCNVTRPEWSKLKHKLENKYSNNSNIVVVDVNNNYLNDLKYIGDVDGFPTMKYIHDKGNKVENYEDASIFNKDRTVESFVKWIESKINTQRGGNKYKSTVYNVLKRLSLKKRKISKTGKKSKRKQKKRKTDKKSKLKQNKSRKNVNKYLGTLDIKCDKWNCLQKTGCAYINDNTKCISTKKLKKIALEEAIIWPTQTKDVNESDPLEYYINIGEGNDKYNKLLDITGLRLEQMKENNVIYQVISPTASGIQNLHYYEDQVKKAEEVNNYMYDKIKDYPNNFKAFATLPMQDPEKAALELERCVKELGFVGALVNGNDVKYNSDGTKNVLLFYDTPDYDILWAKFVELDVPLYIHPRVYPSLNTTQPDPLLQDFYNEYPELPGSAWGFSIFLGQHILRLIISGVFDRFPEFKLILGHMGEYLVWAAPRFDHRLCVYKNELNQISKKKFKELGLPTFTIPKLTLTEYLRKNIYVTTSGWFSTESLNYVIKTMGIDRVMFSIDYPYESQYLASDWMDSLSLSLEDKEKIAYKNAAKLLKLQID